VTYATQTDLVERFGEEELIQLTDRANVGAIDSAVLARAIADADAEIDSYVRAGGHTVPLSPVPDVVSRLAADIVRYRLHDDAATDEVRKRYEDARRTLEAIAAGRVSLGADDAVTTATGRPVLRAGVSGHDWDKH
jgi:phage gp36-like protein